MWWVLRLCREVRIFILQALSPVSHVHSFPRQPQCFETIERLLETVVFIEVQPLGKRDIREGKSSI